MFGAGHVGLSIYRIAQQAGFEVIVVDDREAYANRERFPEAREIHAGDLDSVLPQLAPPDSSYLVIAMRGHLQDMRALQWALGCRARYIGMIGSRRKVRTVFRELEQQGVPAREFDRVYAPIGLDLGATSPEEIAVAIVAEMIAIRRGCQAPLPHLRDRVSNGG
jgi:xanthine dehydrogenase accessory factor